MRLFASPSWSSSFSVPPVPLWTCGRYVDRLGHHGLSCRYSAGRLPCHANINDVVKCGLAVAGVPSWLEPVGLDRGDGRRPDGLIVFLFSWGKSLCWNATCSDTFCQTILPETVVRPGAAANAAEEGKRRHFSGLKGRYRFDRISVETTGVIGKSSTMFLYELGYRISSATGDRRETSLLLQRISLVIAKGNVATILVTGSKWIWKAFNYLSSIDVMENVWFLWFY